MRRELKGSWARIARGLAIAFALYQFFTAGFGAPIDMQHRAIHVAFALVLTFLLIAPRKSVKAETKVPIWDILLVFLVIAATANTFFNWERFILQIGVSTSLDLFLGAAIVLLALETGRRTVGWVFPILTTAMLLYAFFGYLIPGTFHHSGFKLVHIIQFLNQTAYAVWGPITGISATVLAIFIIFGSFLLFSGGGQTFIDIALRLAGRFRGGPAMVAVVASSLFGTISGAAVANVMATGSFTIPLMKRLGYKSEFAGAVEATASTGGQIMPPIMGVGAFIMAELLGISYLKVAIAAVIPALLYYLAVLVSVRFEALRMGLPPVPAAEIPTMRQSLTWAKLAPLAIPIFFLLGLLARGFDITTAGFYASASTVIIFLFSDFSLLRMKHRVGVIIDGLERAGKMLIEIVSVVVCAAIVVGLINLTGVGLKLSEMIMGVGAEHLLLSLILAAMTALILGMGMPTVAAYLLSAVVAAPALIQLGLMPLIAHLFVFYFAILAQITPPVCVAAYAAASIAGASWLKIAFWAMRLAIVAYFIPYLFAYEPVLLMMGKPVAIVLAVLSGSIGVISLAAGITGYLTTRLTIPARMLLFSGGALLFHPGMATDLSGVALIAVALLIQSRAGFIARAKKVSPDASSRKDNTT